MIKVACTVENFKEKRNNEILETNIGPELIIRSSEKGYGVVLVELSGVKDGFVLVKGNDLITAIENCMQTGRLRRYRPYARYEDEDNN